MCGIRPQKPDLRAAKPSSSLYIQNIYQIKVKYIYFSNSSPKTLWWILFLLFFFCFFPIAGLRLIFTDMDFLNDLAEVLQLVFSRDLTSSDKCKWYMYWVKGRVRHLQWSKRGVSLSDLATLYLQQFWETICTGNVYSLCFKQNCFLNSRINYLPKLTQGNQLGEDLCTSC